MTVADTEVPGAVWNIRKPQTERSRGLALKIVGVTFPIITAIVLLTQVVIGYANYHNEWLVLHARADLIARLTAEAIAQPVWNLDRPTYESQIRAIGRDAAFVKAALIDPRGTVLFEQIGQQARPTDLEVSVPVVEPGSNPPSTTATLRLSLSNAELAAGIRQQMLIGLVAFIVLLATFAMTIHLALRHMVLRPVNLLLDAMGKVERKDWQTADWSSQDEVGRVVVAFNRMVKNLRSGDEAQRLLRELTVAQRQLRENNDKLERANKLVVDSINYASRIQTALLPALDPQRGIGDIAVIWEPRDIVGGDYFWVGELDGRTILMLVDCTGHGVPGAFMTMIVASVLDRVLADNRQGDPAAMLKMIDGLVRTLLRQDRDEGTSDDGLDAAICVYDPDTRELRFAGAMIPLIAIEDGKATIVKGDRQSLGYRTAGNDLPFTTRSMFVAPNTAIYLASDGVIDQFAPNGPLFGRRRLIETLLANTHLPLPAQMDAIRERLNAHRGGEACPDDVTLLACRLD